MIYPRFFGVIFQVVVGGCLSKNPLFTRYYKVLVEDAGFLKNQPYGPPIHAVYIISIRNNLANTKMP